MISFPPTSTSKAYIGQVGINHGLLFPEPEIGWLLYPNGFAIEAATALRDRARDVRCLATLVSYIDPANAASIRVARRLGARQDPDAATSDPDDLVFRHFGA